MDKPILIFDGACEFCRRSVQRWQARTGDRVTYLPLQRRGILRALGIAPSDAFRAVQLVTPDCKRYSGADAVFRTLEYAPEPQTLARIGRLPLLRALADVVYRQIAKHRGLAGHIDSLLRGTSTAPAGALFVRRAFVRSLGGVFLVAFSSLSPQLKGLYGKLGIQPIDELLAAARKRLPPRERLRRFPTVFWLDASDGTLAFACRAGQLASLLLALGIAPRTTAALAWLLYLSFVSPGREMLSYQWDALLLENGLHAMAIGGSRTTRPPWTTVALMRWLAARLQFESGHCKLASRDRAWRTGEACVVHFETQPLPTRLGWYAHQAPRSVKRAATYATLAIELGAPILAFAPRRLRHLGFALLTGLQGLIAATGNYGFFNLLTLVDNLWLLDDAALGRTRSRGTRPRWWQHVGTAAAALPIVALSLSVFVSRMFTRARIPQPLDKLHAAVAPLRSVSPYGLFAVMTMDRPEIVIEGSDDGATWREYQFRYKPGALDKPPRLAAPHQPRLDWQMWFAALGPAPAWFVRLLERLLEGTPEVLSLFASNPFPDHAPRYVRALLYDYHMTDRQTRRNTGAWWRRELLGTYVPAVKLA